MTKKDLSKFTPDELIEMEGRKEITFEEASHEMNERIFEKWIKPLMNKD